MTALLESWSGPTADAYRARWDQVKQGLEEFDHRVHTCSDHLRRLAGHIEDAQSAYDHALGLAGMAAVAGIGLTLFTGGASDVVAGEAEGAIGGTLEAVVAEFQGAVGRCAALIGEMADLMGSLATRFAMEFEIRAPAPVVAAAAGAATNVAFSLADGARAPGELLENAAIGAAGEGAGLGRRGGVSEGEEVEMGAAQRAWRASLSSEQAAKQAEFDADASWLARPANFSAVREPLTGDLARAIDAQSPGAVMLINQRVVDPAASGVQELTDLDIVTANVVIQVKSGRTRGLSSQMDKSRQVTGKMVVAYAPSVTDNEFRRYAREGYTVFRALPDLLEFLRGFHGE